MKRTLLVANLMLSVAFLATAQKTPESMLGAALHQEEVQGDLKGAIAAYQKVVTAPGVSRKTAAEALVHMGQCYEKLGDAESRKAYERVVRDYADQKEAVAMARTRLGRSGPVVRDAGIVTRQVWPDAIDTEGAPSPDGRYLTFVDWSTGDLAIRDLATGKNRRLTNKGTWQESPEFALFSVFSPDGKQVAYAWFGGEKDSWGIRIVPVGAGSGIAKPRVLYHREGLQYIEPHGWSQDGKQVLALSTRDDRAHQIALLSVADGTAQILKTFDWRAPTKMSLSPDSRYIAYDFPPKEDSPQRNIFVLATDGSREFAVVEHAANDLAPMWTPDGKHLLFTSDRTGQMGAWTVPVADGKAQGPAALVKADIGRILPMAFTRSGSLFYSTMIGDHNIFVASLDFTTGKVQEPAKPVSESFTGNHSSPDWSADGRFLAYLSVQNFVGGRLPFSIFIRSLETGEQREIRTGLGYVGGVRWSPDGQSFAAWGSDEKGRKGIFRVDARTGAATALVSNGQDIRHPLWSPDGKSIYYNDFNTGRTVARHLESGIEKELIPPGRLYSSNGSLSRDGKRLLLIRSGDYEKKSSSITVVSTDGGELHEILSLPDISGQVLEWEPDGRGVIFARADNSELWRVPVEGGTPEKLGIRGEKMRGLRLHPDGMRIAFNAGSTKAEVWVMENLLSNLPASK